MKSIASNTDFRARIIDERKPLRPVQVASTRRPIKVTKTMGHGIETVPARARRI